MNDLQVIPSRRTAFFDSVVNHPDIYKRISDEKTPIRGDFTLAPQIGQIGNVFLEIHRGGREAGFFALLRRGTVAYEVHTQMLPGNRGATAVKAAEIGMDWMFLNTDAEVLTSFAWSNRPEAAWFARNAGMREDCKRPHPHLVDGEKVETTWFSISLHEWLRQAWPRYQAIGHQFHEQLFDQQGHDSHPEDPNHDGMLGLTLVMGILGNPIKAQIVYNRWAAATGYGQAKFLGQRGGVYAIDIGNAVIEVDQNMKVNLVERRVS